MDRLALTRRDLLGAGLALSAGAMVRAAPVTGFDLAGPGGRRIMVSAWRARGRRRGTILFSHGALSAPAKYSALIEPWAAAGYDVFAPLHVDSTDHPDTASYPGLASWRARLEDMAALAAHGGGASFIAAGHSYGGLVALTFGGAAAVRPEGYAGPMHESRVRAALAFSPPGPAPGLVDAAGYGALAVPALIQTGTLDVPQGAPADAWRTHLAAYDAAAPGGYRYGLVLDGADHYFGNIICRPERAVPPQTSQFAAASRLSLLFLDAYGRGDDGAARARLDAEGRADGPVKLATR